MIRWLVSALFAAMVFVTHSAAQQVGSNDPVAWVQIEARPSLAQAQERARAYASALPDVNGFTLGNGWYGIALGPYAPDDAREVLRVYRREGRIPRDSYIAYTQSFRQQFWPIGADLITRDTPPEETTPSPTEAPASEPTTPTEPAAALPAEEPGETLQEARAAERALSNGERKLLQIALKWSGYYTSTIDGAFGKGTRRSMAAWQKANEHKATGVLTTKQREQLLKQYYAVFEGLGMRTVTENTTGIELALPTSTVKFSKYAPPFAHFESQNDLGARVILISQEGDRDTLNGLYDIMQTLEIVPENGPRERRKNSFTLVGEGDDFISHTEAQIKNGVIKGFTLVWPTGDEARRARVLAEMQQSFTWLSAVMPDDAGDDGQSIDLVAGLEVRKPKLSRSGFFLSAAGHIATTSEAVDSCTKLTIDGEAEADVLANDAGIAILKPRTAVSPPARATLAEREARLESEVAASGFSYEGALTAPTLTFGHLADIKGLGGEPDLKRLELGTLSGDAGGPVFDSSGAVLGMLLPTQSSSNRQLPENVKFAVSALKIRTLAESVGVSGINLGRSGHIAPEDLTVEAMGLTVLVSCWGE